MSEESGTVSNQEIKEMIKEYVGLSVQLDEHNKGAKELRNKKKNYEETIQNFMVNNNLAKINLGSGGTIKITKSKIAKKLTKKEIFEFLLTTLEEQKTEEIINEMFIDGDEK